jgi:hypothetical protein
MFLLRLGAVAAFAFLSQRAIAQDAKPRRDPINKLRERDLLPKAPAKPQPWRPVYKIDDVSEIAFEALLHPCEHASGAAAHCVATLNKIRRLDRERLNGFQDAIERYRPDLKDLPFTGAAEAGMTPERRAIEREFGLAWLAFRRGTSNPLAFASPLVAQPPDDSGERLMWPKPGLRSGDELRAIADLAMHRLFHLDGEHRLNLVQILQSLPDERVSPRLAHVAVFAPESEVREAAVASLLVRRSGAYEYVLVRNLTHPLPQIVQNAADALIKLQVEDPYYLEPIARLLKYEEVRDFGTAEEPVRSVKEVVKLNHLRNCMLCHPPSSQAHFSNDNALNANVPNPREKLSTPMQISGGYGAADLAQAIRFDVSYLRPDFSLTLPVDEKTHAGVWPDRQRFDFLVRRRRLTSAEYKAYEKSRPFLPPNATRAAALHILRELTGYDDEPDVDRWIDIIRKVTNERAERIRSNRLKIRLGDLDLDDS